MINFIDSEELQTKQIHSILSHLTFAQVTWLDRISGSSSFEDNNEWLQWSWDDVRDKCLESSHQLVQLIDKHEDFDLVVKYSNTSGTEHERSVGHILTHLLHSTSFHRGQAVGNIHQGENMMTPSFDFIDFINS